MVKSPKSFQFIPVRFQYSIFSRLNNNIHMLQSYSSSVSRAWGQLSESDPRGQLSESDPTLSNDGYLVDSKIGRELDSSDTKDEKDPQKIWMLADSSVSSQLLASRPVESHDGAIL